MKCLWIKELKHLPQICLIPKPKALSNYHADSRLINGIFIGSCIDKSGYDW